MLAIGGLTALGLWLGGEKARWLGVALPALGVSGAPGLIGWSLDRFGVVEEAVVADRRESIQIRGNGGWAPRYDIAVRLPESDRELIGLRADQTTFDALHFGDPVRIRSLPFRKTIRRLERMPTAGWIRGESTLEWIAVLRTLALVVVGLTVIGGRGRAGLLRAAFGVALIGVGAWRGSRRIEPYRGEPEPSGPFETVRGRVRDQWRIDEVWGGLGVARPYLVVTIEFTPAGARSALLGVDAIDAGSVAHLERGDQVEVRYAPGMPRRIRLPFGTRGFVEANRSTGVVLRGGLIGLLALLAGLRWWLVRGRPSRVR